MLRSCRSAGLATAVYAASKACMLSWSTAGPTVGRRASARIENYLGFLTAYRVAPLPTAYVHLKFGVEMLIPAQVATLDCGRGAHDGNLSLTLADGRKLKSRTVVIASGARYRRPALPRLAEFEGRGVWYWASSLEAKTCTGAEVALGGGGNSAGQAAVSLGRRPRCRCWYRPQPCSQHVTLPDRSYRGIVQHRNALQYRTHQTAR
jgi:thioredoxin reductase (NADPH)